MLRFPAVLLFWRPPAHFDDLELTGAKKCFPKKMYTRLKMFYPHPVVQGGEGGLPGVDWRGKCVKKYVFFETNELDGLKNWILTNADFPKM